MLGGRAEIIRLLKFKKWKYRINFVGFWIKCKFKEENEFTQLNFKGHTIKVYKIKNGGR